MARAREQPNRSAGAAPLPNEIGKRRFAMLNRVGLLIPHTDGRVGDRIYGAL